MSFTRLDHELTYENGVTQADNIHMLIKLTDTKFVTLYTIDGYQAVNEDGSGGVDFYVDQLRARVGVVTTDGTIHQYEDTLLFDGREGKEDWSSSFIIARATRITEESVAVFIIHSYRELGTDPITIDMFVLPCHLGPTEKTLVAGIAAPINEPEEIHTVGSLGIWNTYSGSGGLVYITDIAGVLNITVRGFTMTLSSAVIGDAVYHDSGDTGNVFIEGHTAISDTKSIVSYSVSGDSALYLLPGNFSGTTVSLGTRLNVGSVAGFSRREGYLDRLDDNHFVLYRNGEVQAYNVSGFTMTGGNVVTVQPGGSASVEDGAYNIQAHPIAVVEDNLAIVFYETFDNISDILTYAAHFTFSGTTTTRHSDLSFDNDYTVFRSINQTILNDEVDQLKQTTAVYMGQSRFLIGYHDAVDFDDNPEYGFGWWDFGTTLLVETDLFDIEYTSVYLIGESSIGSTSFVTAWADGYLILNVIDLSLGQQVDSILLGYASLSQVLNKTYIAYPCALSNSAVFIFGRINNGAVINHILFSSDSGSNFEVIENSWGADFAGAMVCRAVDDYFVMRCNPEYSKLYQNNAEGLGIKSTLPFAGPVEPHGLRQSDWDDSLLAVVDKAGEPQTVVYTFEPYLAWEDVTLNHPQTEVNAVVPL